MVLCIFEFCPLCGTGNSAILAVLPWMTGYKQSAQAGESIYQEQETYA